MISVLTADGGKWVKAVVTELRHRQEHWCPDFFCAYMVLVEYDMTPDGVSYGSPVREDDERVIRSYGEPPRFAVGARIECMGPKGWVPGTVCKHWCMGKEGELLPYSVDLDGSGMTVAVWHDGDEAIRQMPDDVLDPWEDGDGVEAAYDLLLEGKALPEASGEGGGTSADARSDVLARCKTEKARVAAMVRQLLEAAEGAPDALIGRRVRVRGLEGDTDLNGRIGTAKRYLPSRGRFEVHFERPSKVVGVRDVNVEPATPKPTVTCPICMEVKMDDPLGPAKKGPQGGCATVTMCCGKVVCESCHAKVMCSRHVADGFPPCPFCRAPTGYVDDSADDQCMKRLLKRRASQADPIAMYNLSASYDMGRYDLPTDYQASISWAALSASAGHVRAMNNVGYACRDGEGVRADAARALRWWRRAAVHNHVSSIWALGRAYRDGLGVNADLPTAKKWFRRGTELGDFECKRDLAMLPPPHGEGSIQPEEEVASLLGASGQKQDEMLRGMPPEVLSMLMGEFQREEGYAGSEGEDSDSESL